MLKTEEIELRLSLSVAPLHAVIRPMEFFTGLARSLRSKDPKEQSEFKAQYQKEFQRLLRIKVDFPKQGFGNTNTGNVGWVFFKNYAITSQILGIDRELLRLFLEILNNLNSKKEVAIEEHFKLCSQAFSILREKYSDSRYSPTVHKILAHSSQILSFLKSTGLYSEQAQEAKNKEVRFLRLNRARKMSRVANLTDIMRNMWAKSSYYLRSRM